MEDKGDVMVTDKNETGHRNEVAESDNPQGDANGIPKPGKGSAQDIEHPYNIYPDSENDLTKEEPQHCGQSGEVNMEATIDPDDVIRAGGFGARDDLSSFLPVASDSTDLEASLLDAREYEEPQGERSRPGLGWSDNQESE